MAEDPYKVLGVARGASDKEIRSAYRKLAKEKHPDLNPGDKAAETFKKISGAYAILGDAKKRSSFDRGEIDAGGAPRGFQGGAPGQGGFRGSPYGQQRAGWPPGQGDAGFGDIFSDLFGGQRGQTAGGPGAAYAMRGQDVRYTLEVDFIEAVKGAKKRVTLPQGGALDLSVPAGVTDSQTLRLKGKGAVGMRGGPAGDALIEIKVRGHRDFKRSGDDILIDLPITIDEAILGAKVEVPTVDGRVHAHSPARHEFWHCVAAQG